MIIPVNPSRKSVKRDFNRSRTETNHLEKWVDWVETGLQKFCTEESGRDFRIIPVYIYIFFFCSHVIDSVNVFFVCFLVLFCVVFLVFNAWLYWPKNDKDHRRICSRLRYLFIGVEIKD